MARRMGRANLGQHVLALGLVGRRLEGLPPRRAWYPGSAAAWESLVGRPVPADGTLHVEHYVRSAHTAERGKLDMIFFAEILYSYEQNERHCGQMVFPTLDPVELISTLAGELTALTLMVFFVLAMQCMSTIAVVRRETNSWSWPLFMTAYMTGLAYVAARLALVG